MLDARLTVGGWVVGCLVGCVFIHVSNEIAEVKHTAYAFAF